MMKCHKQFGQRAHLTIEYTLYLTHLNLRCREIQVWKKVQTQFPARHHPNMIRRNGVVHSEVRGGINCQKNTTFVIRSWNRRKTQKMFLPEERKLSDGSDDIQICR